MAKAKLSATTKQSAATKLSVATKQSDAFIHQAIELVQAARQHVVRQTNSVMVFTYYQIGRLIVEHEQAGNLKAEYGKATIIALSKKLSKEFGQGFSIDNLENMRNFFIVFQYKFPLVKSEPVARKSSTKKISQTLSAELPYLKSEPVARKSFSQEFPLSWTHYVILSRIENADERSFYEIEALQCNWGKRELQRQLNRGLFERLSLSKNKKRK